MENPFTLIETRLQNIENLLISITSQPATPPATPTDNIRLYGDRAAATYLNCTPLTVQNLRKRGAIPFYRYGRKVFFIASELDTALKVENRRYGRKSDSVGSCHCASKS